jgi:mycothiol synthase
MMTTMRDGMTWIDLADAPPIERLRVRRPRGIDADYEAMASVVLAANAHDGIPWLPTPTNLREEFEGSTRRDQANDVVIVELKGRPVAEAGIERVIRDGTVIYETWGHVVPEVRRRGIGRALLRENLRRATERADDEDPGRPVEARSYAEEGEAGHRALLETHGFEEVRWFFLMRRPTLDDIPDAPLPAGLEIRPVTPDQHRAIWDAEVEAFRDHWSPREPTEEDFTTTFSRSELDTDLWVVAWDGDEVAGVVENWIWAEENARLGIARGWNEKISVRRPWRRLGLGRAITAASLRRLRAAGMTEAMLGVDAENPTGALGLYEGLGFERFQRASAYRRQLER